MATRRPKRRVRAPDETRGKLLNAAFQEMYRHGFQAASLETILARAGVTKGALYHHFPDKAALGYAVVEEVVRGLMLTRWLGPLEQDEGDAVTGLRRVLRQRAENLTSRETELGCPLNNLAQEMSPLDQRFRRAIDAVFEAWRAGFAQVLERGQAEGTVRQDVDPNQVAAFIVAAAEGSYGLAKGANSAAMLKGNLTVLELFVEGLREGGKGKVVIDPSPPSG